MNWKLKNLLISCLQFKKHFLNVNKKRTTNKHKLRSNNLLRYLIYKNNWKVLKMKIKLWVLKNKNVIFKFLKLQLNSKKILVKMNWINSNNKMRLFLNKWTTCQFKCNKIQMNYKQPNNKTKIVNNKYKHSMFKPKN